MSVLGEIFDSLKAMSLLQLLFAFIACIGYAVAQGALFGARTRRWACSMAALAAFAFALESAEWTIATMVLGFAIAGMGLFIAAVWCASWMLGFARARAAAPLDELAAGPLTLPPAGPRARSACPTEHAHSL